MSVHHNLAASFLGNTWTAIVQIAFIPLYIHILGMEAYGLMGVYAVLQVSLAFIDLGLIPTISREMARYRAGALSLGAIRTLLRSVEGAFLCVALVLAACVAAMAPWLAASWLKADTLPVAGAAFATLRGAGVIPVLVRGSPTITAFFLFQAVIGLVELVVLFLSRGSSCMRSHDRPCPRLRCAGSGGFPPA